jgi:hypothetical protein
MLTRWFVIFVAIRSHMQISEIDRRVLGIEKKTLDDIRKEMIAHKQEEELTALELLRVTELEERHTRESLRNAAGYLKQSITTRLAALATTITGIKKDITNYQATLAYFESIIPKVTFPSRYTPVCHVAEMRYMLSLQAGFSLG